jgi:DNA polymerase (family 10)
MKNEEIAKLLFEIGDLLEIENIPFKPKAYQEAAISIDNLDRDIEEIYKDEGLKGIESISKVGKNIALKIEEYLKTGKLKYYKELKKRNPVDIETFLKIEGLGHKRIKVLYQELGIRNLDQLKEAIEKNKLEDLYGFGKITQNNILQGIDFLEKHHGRVLMSEVEEDVNRIFELLKKQKEVSMIEVAGSFRRRKETIGDIDILVASSFPKKIMNIFTTMDEVEKVWGSGLTKSSIRLKKGFDVDLRIVSEKSFGAALQYFTGSKAHNVHLRKIAIKKGYKLNEYGLYEDDRCIASKTEKEIYNKLGMEYIPSELRENRGEIDLAILNKLPKLIELQDIKGDLHCHSNWSDGVYPIEEIVLKAISLDYKYIGISDHTRHIVNGLTEDDLLNQAKEIKKLNKKYEGKIKILHGAEVNILDNGELDIKNSVLKKLDYVAVGIHSKFKMDQTKRILKALENPYVTFLVHPTGRIINKRESYKVDLDAIFNYAKGKNIYLEINASSRMDLNEVDIKRAKKIGCKFVINTDAHQLVHFDRIKYGVYQARRGWLSKKDVINTKNYGEIIRSNSL